MKLQIGEYDGKPITANLNPAPLLYRLFCGAIAACIIALAFLTYFIPLFYWGERFEKVNPRKEKNCDRFNGLYTYPLSNNQIFYGTLCGGAFWAYLWSPFLVGSYVTYICEAGPVLRFIDDNIFTSWGIAFLILFLPCYAIVVAVTEYRLAKLKKSFLTDRFYQRMIPADAKTEEVCGVTVEEAKQYWSADPVYVAMTNVHHPDFVEAGAQNAREALEITHGVITKWTILREVIARELRK